MKIKISIFAILLFVGFAIQTNAQINAWQMDWNFQGVRYNALLWFPADKSNPIMRVRYEYNGTTQIIEERFNSVVKNGVVVLVGYAPRFLYADNPKAQYYADNIVMFDGHIYSLFSLDDISNPNAWSEIKNPTQINTTVYFNSLKANTYPGY